MLSYLYFTYLVPLLWCGLKKHCCLSSLDLHFCLLIDCICCLLLKHLCHSHLQLLHSLMTTNLTEVMSGNGLRMLEELLCGLVRQIHHNNGQFGLVCVCISVKVTTGSIYLVQIQLQFL